MAKTADQKVNILLVDDNPANLLALAAVLDDPSYHLVLAHSGKEALENLKTLEFAVVLLDVQMPEMDGFEVARRLRALPTARNTPVIFVTAIYREAKFIHNGYAAGGVDYLFKPLDPAIVKSKVAIFVELYQKNNFLRAQQKSASRLVAVQQVTTEVLAKATDVDSAVSEVLKQVCRTLGWDLGTYWNLDSQGQVLKCRQFWSDPSCPATLISNAAKESCPLGIGLPGRVWIKNTSMWSKEGLGCALAFPLNVEGKIRGVMEFFSRSEQSEDADLLKILNALGSQIGQYMGRMEALSTARESIMARDEFLSIASHELKTPLTVMRLQTQFNRRRLIRTGAHTLTPEDLEKFMNVTVNQVEKMIHLVESMLDVSRIINGKLVLEPETVDLSDIVKMVVDGHNVKSDGTLAHRFDCRLIGGVTGAWDKMKIEQVISNLVSNAIKYGGEGVIEIALTGDTDVARVSIRDSGPGISENDLERIFKRFERATDGTKVSGLGLGLYISREIIQAHGGTLLVESKLGEGSTFTIELPRRHPRIPVGKPEERPSATRYV